MIIVPFCTVVGFRSGNKILKEFYTFSFFFRSGSEGQFYFILVEKLTINTLRQIEDAFNAFRIIYSSQFEPVDKNGSMEEKVSSKKNLSWTVNPKSRTVLTIGKLCTTSYKGITFLSCLISHCALIIIFVLLKMRCYPMKHLCVMAWMISGSS